MWSRIITTRMLYIISGVTTLIGTILISIFSNILTVYIPIESLHNEPEIQFKGLHAPYDGSLSKRIDEAIETYEGKNYKKSLLHLNSISASLDSPHNHATKRQKSLIFLITGACYFELAQYQKSIKYLNKSIALFPFSYSHKLLGEIYYHLLSKSKSKSKSKKYLKKYKEHSDKAYSLKVTASSSLNNLEQKFYSLVTTKGLILSTSTKAIASVDSMKNTAFFLPDSNVKTKLSVENLESNFYWLASTSEKMMLSPSTEIIVSNALTTSTDSYYLESNTSGFYSYDTNNYDSSGTFTSLFNTIDRDFAPSSATVSSAINTSFLSSSKKTGKVYFVSIGINSYNDKKITNLNYAEKDASDILYAFREIYGDNLYKYKLSGENATKENILSLFYSIRKIINPNDMLYIYYSGHGYSNNKNIFEKNSYIIPFDIKKDNVKGTAISVKDIDVIFSTMKKPISPIVILDSCNEVVENTSQNKSSFIFPSIAYKSLSENIGIEKKYYNKENILKKIYNNSDTIVITSSSNGEPSSESNKLKNGVFTYYLIKEIKNKKNREYNISVVFNTVQKNIDNYLKNMNLKQKINISVY